MGDVLLNLDENFKKMVIREDRRELSVYRNDVIDELKSRGVIGKDSSPTEEITSRKDQFFTIGLVIGGGVAISFLASTAMALATKDGYDFEEMVCSIAILAITGVLADCVHILYGRRITMSVKKVLNGTKKPETIQRIELKKSSTELLLEKKRILDEKLNL